MHLFRQWDSDRPEMMLVMLNPSTADGMTDDPTIRKCIGFATRLGFGSIVVVNLFSYRATDPLDLKKAGYPQGETDNGVIRVAAGKNKNAGGRVVAAWGRNAPAERAAAVRTMLRNDRIRLFHFGLTKDGQPRHPLMLPYATPMIEWTDP